jgi:hypothetical protein
MSWKVIKRSKTLGNAQKLSGERSRTLRNGHERSGTVNGQEHVGTIESERSNALERIVENGHGTVTLTHQKRKKHCRFFYYFVLKIIKIRN